MRPGILKRVLRWTFFPLLGLLLVMILLVASALVWLRTSSAEKYLSELIYATLAEQGLRLEMTEFGGRLPGYISARDITLADQQGTFFQAEELELRLSLGALLRKTVRVDTLRLQQAQLRRLP